MKITQILELQALAPGEQNRAQAYGSAETPAKTTTPAGNKKPTATYMDQGEEKQGEVVNDDGINVTVKTDTGKTLRLPKDKVTVSENSEPINEDEFASSGKSAFIKRIKSQQEWKNGEYWQALMNVVYDDWQQPKLAEYGYAQFVEHVGSSYGDLAKLSLLLGKYNQQVTNGGHAQYTDNQYAGQYAGRNWNGEFSPFLHVELIDLFKKYNLSSLSHGGEVLSIMNDYLERIKDYNYDVEEWENQADPEDRAKADLERMGQPEPEPQEFETEEEYMDALSMWENEVSSLIDEYEEEEPHIMNYTGNLDKAYFAIYEDFTEDYNKWIGSKLKSQGFMGKIKGMFSRESTELDKIRRLAGLNESGMKRVIHKVMDELDAGIGEAQIARDLGISTNTVAEIKRDYYGPAQEQERSRIKGLWKQNEEVEENEEIARIKRLSGIK